MKIQYQSSNLTIFESALFRTTTTVFINEDLILIVDPNWLPQEIDEIKKFVDENKKDQALYLLFTHSDYDHIIGYKAFPEAKTIASKAFQDNPSKEESIRLIEKFDDEYYITRNYPIEYPKIDIAIENEGERLEIGKTSLTFYQAKGHNPDGIFTIIEPVGIWIAGDYLSNIEFPYIYHSSLEYLKTLSKVDFILKNHDINLLITGHGDCTSDYKEIKKRELESRDYIESLRKCIQSGKQFDFDELMNKYNFPIIMKKFHEENIKLISRAKARLG